jgi:hypothetical protein
MKEYYISEGLAIGVTYTEGTHVATLAWSAFDLDLNTVVATGSGTHSTVGHTWTITLPASIASYDRVLRLDLTLGGTTQESFFIKLVKQYASASEIAAFLDLTITDTPTTSTQVTTAALNRYERLAREVINSEINSEFTKRHVKVGVLGNDSDVLPLNRHLLEIRKIWKDDELYYDSTNTAASLFDYPIEINNTGFGIKIVSAGDNIDEWTQNHTYAIPSSGVWIKNSMYIIEGIFGSSYVPNDINMATSLLVEDYRCSDAGVRNKYIESNQNQAYTIKYNQNAFFGTGNAVVDTILSKYKDITLMVV